MHMKKSSGFTLIELVIVIVILGVLAAVAAPRFTDMKGDARKATMQKIAGTGNSTLSLVYAKALVAGVHTSANATINLNGTNVQLRYGYPTLLSIVNVFQLTPVSAFTMQALSSSSGRISPVGATAATCHIVYTQAPNASTPATLQQVLTNCD